MSDAAQISYRAAPPFPVKSIGFWMAVLIVGLMALNTGRAFLAPVEFAQYLGLPLSDPPNVGFVYVYGLRAFFLGLFALVLILRRDFIALQWYALTAVVMAIGDAYLVTRSGGPLAIVARHLATGLYLVITALMLRRMTRQASTTE